MLQHNAMNFKKVIEDWERELNADDGDKTITVVNAGLMNAGKSSLFNALANEESLFAVDDIPTTVVCQHADIGNEVVLIDTPGLDVRDADSDEAFKAYRNAELILFVHNVNTGEMHTGELDVINCLEKLFPTPKDFWERFVVICSRADLKSVEGLQEIVKKIQDDLIKHCDGHNVPVFVVSAKRYMRGLKENKKPFIVKSGILELRDYIVAVSAKLHESRFTLKEERLAMVQKKVAANLTAERSKLASKVEAETGKHAAQLNQANKEITQLKDNVRLKWKACKRLVDEYNNL